MSICFIVVEYRIHMIHDAGNIIFLLQSYYIRIVRIVHGAPVILLLLC